MVAPLLVLILFCSTIAGVDTTDARHVVLQAIHAVEGDSIVPARSRWSGRLHADSADHAALLGLATLARLTYDYPASDRLYLRLVSADSLHPDAYAVYALLGRAWSLEERGRSDAAGQEFTRARDAARAAGAPAAEAEALIGLAFALGPTAGLAAGKAILDTAGPLIPATALDLQAERGWRRAMIRALLGDPGATAEATASVAVARRSGELRVQAQAVRGLARVLDWRGEEDSALAAFEEAERLFRAARDRSWLAVTLMNKGNLFRKRGDLGETIEALRLTTAEGELSHNLWAVASAHTGLGVVALQLNDFPEASRQLSQAVTMFEAQGDRSSAMNARSFLPLIALADRDCRDGQATGARGARLLSGDGGDPGPVRRSPDALHDLYPGARLGRGRAGSGGRAGAPPETRWSTVGSHPDVRPGAAGPGPRRPGAGGAVLPPVSGGARQRRPSCQVRRAAAAGGHLRRARRSGCGRARGRVGLGRARALARHAYRPRAQAARVPGHPQRVPGLTCRLERAARERGAGAGRACRRRTGARARSNSPSAGARGSSWTHAAGRRSACAPLRDGDERSRRPDRDRASLGRRDCRTHSR